MISALLARAAVLLALVAARFSTRPILLLASARARRGDRRGARALLVRAATRAPARASGRPALDLALARLHQELGSPFEALLAARAVLARQPANVAAAEIAIRSAHRLEREDEAAALLRGIFAEAGLAQPGDGAVIARLLLATGRIDEAAAAAREASPGRDTWPVQLDAAYAAGDYAAAEGAADRLAALGPLGRRHRRMQGEIERARAIVADPAARFPHALFERAFARPSNASRAADDLVVLVTATLANAGAERQLAQTARLVAEARSEAPGARTLLLVGSLDDARGYAARLPLALSPHLMVEDLSRRPIAAIRRELADENAPDDDVALIDAFPEKIAEEMLRLYARFRALRPSVVHLWQDGTIATGAVAAVLAGVPRIVGAIRNVLPAAGDRRRAAPWLFAMYRALAARADVRFAANSEAGARDYAEMMKIDPGAIAVIRNGVDPAAIVAAAGEGRSRVRADLGIASDAPLIGGAFRLARQKRPALWIETAVRIAAARPDARFVILGDGVMRAEMEALADRLGLGRRLLFAGARDPVEPWLAALDLYLLCSAQEGSPNALIEAQALGVPAVITPAGGAPEAIADGLTGVLVATDEPPALADAALGLLADPVLREAMARTAPAFVVRRFELERMIEGTLALYEA